MKPRLIAAAGLLAASLPAMALARPNPVPPPSGIVIHLFGPHSITSHILPQSAEPASPAPAPSYHAAAAAGPPGPAAGHDDGAPVAGITPTASEQGPDVGGILHQMFVTGDPDQKPGAALSVGRGNDRQFANAPNGKPAASGD